MQDIFRTDGLKAATRYFDDAVLKYGRERLEAAICSAEYAKGAGGEPIKYVGQFIDREGVNSKQRGVYGMSAWLALTDSTSPGATPLRTACRQALVEWTAETSAGDIAERPSSEGYELRFVIPKICYAYRGLMAAQGEDHARVLAGYVRTANSVSNGSWGLLTSDRNGEPCMSALVVRTLRGEADFSKLLPEAINYLYNHYNDSKSPCLRLYVLNTIRIADPQCAHLANVKSRKLNRLIRGEIKALHKTISRDPLSLANPITLHFSDDRGGRLRYYRFPGDLIVLESLLLVSGPYIRYYRSHFGRRIGSRLAGILEGSNDLAVDTCGDRTSFSTCLYIREVLALLENKIPGADWVGWRLLGRLASIISFRPRLTVHFSVALALIVAVLIVHKFLPADFGIVAAAAVVEFATAAGETLAVWIEEHE